MTTPAHQDGYVDLPRDRTVSDPPDAVVGHPLAATALFRRLASSAEVSDAAAGAGVLAALLWRYGGRGPIRVGVLRGETRIVAVSLEVDAAADLVSLLRAAERALDRADAVPADGPPSCGVLVGDATAAACPFELALVVGSEPRVCGAAAAFSRERIAAIAAHLDCLLAGAAEGRALDETEVLPEAERRRLLEEWNDTTAPFPDVTLPELLDLGVHPERVALRNASGEQLTYRELDRRARAVASRLRAAGARPGALVGVCMRRTLDLPVVLLGVLGSGAAYVPLDPDYPADRIEFMLADSRAALVVTEPDLVHRVAGAGAEVLLAAPELWQGGDADSPRAPGCTPEDLAYVIYTSGSTGRPKGVAIEHRNAVAFISWATDLFGPELLRSVLATTSVCFDLSIFELFAPLACGGSVVVLEDALALLDLPPDVDATLVNSVPSLLRTAIDQGELPPSVQAVNLAGEPLPRSLADALHARGVPRVYNLYGPSEDTTYSTFALVDPGSDEAPPIGRPIANTKAYVLDERLRPVPIGVPGELYLGGAGVARGYLGRPDLTAERFLPDPFDPGGRVYRTGDRVRHRPNGELEFLGRQDDQIKIRGYRVEVGEIEHVLREQPEVADAAVVATADELRRLVAFVAPRDAHVGGALELARRRLPQFMVPQRIVAVDEIPLTPNGKVDRLRLQQLAADALRPDRDPADEKVGAPRSPFAAHTVETRVRELWEELLGARPSGVDANFFDLGGQSLQLPRLRSLIEQRLGVELSLVDLLRNPTVRTLAAAIAQASGSPAETVDATSRAPRTVNRRRRSSRAQLDSAS